MSVAVFERELAPELPAGEVMPRGIACSAALHLALLVLVVFGLPKLFHQPPPEDTPIAVELVTIAPETRATKVNPFRPKAEAKPDQPISPPAPKPEPKPEPPPPPSPQPPPSASAPPLPPPPDIPKPEAKPPPPPPPTPKPAEAPPPAPPPLPKPAEAQPPAPPPLPKPAEAQAPAPPPVPRPPEAKPKPEPKPHMAPPKPEPAKKPDPAAFAQLMKNLSQKSEKKPDPAAFDQMTRQLTEKKPEPAAFDSLLKNLTRDQAPSEDTPPQPRRQHMASAAASSQPKAPLGAQLTASEKDLLIQQIERCWVVPAGARDADNLIIEIKAVVNPDGTVRQATIVDTGRYGADQTFRAAADSARRAVLNPTCSPLHVPPDKYEQWHNLDLFFNPKDVL